MMEKMKKKENLDLIRCIHTPIRSAGILTEKQWFKWLKDFWYGRTLK